MPSVTELITILGQIKFEADYSYHQASMLHNEATSPTLRFELGQLAHYCNLVRIISENIIHDSEGKIQF